MGATESNEKSVATVFCQTLAPDQAHLQIAGVAILVTTCHRRFDEQRFHATSRRRDAAMNGQIFSSINSRLAPPSSCSTKLVE